MGRFEDGEGVCRVHVRDAVGHQDDVVEGVRALAAGLVGQPHAQVEPCLHVRRAVRREAADRALDVAAVRSPVLDRVLVEHVGGEVHHGDAVAVAEALADGFRRRPGDVDPVPRGHGAGGIQHERHVERCVVAHLRRLEGDAGDVPPIPEGVLHDVARDGEAIAVPGCVVVVGEGVHPLLRAHRVGLHRVAVLGPGEREVVRGAVGVEAEGRDGIGGRIDEGRAPVVPEGRVRGTRPLWRGLADTLGRGLCRGPRRRPAWPERMPPAWPRPPRRSCPRRRQRPPSQRRPWRRLAPGVKGEPPGWPPAPPPARRRHRRRSRRPALLRATRSPPWPRWS